MKNKIQCCFCNSFDIKFKRNIISQINNKKYDHQLCNNCGLEFFTPLNFENIYESEIHSAYKSHHQGKKNYCEWTKKLVKTLNKLNFNLKNKSILDVGAGDCINFRALVENFNIKVENYTALEYDKLSCKVCKKRGVKNILNIPFDNKILNKDLKGKKFDLIISTEVVEHMINLKDYFETLFSLIKKDGMIILTTPNRDRVFLRKREVDGGDIPPNHFLRFNKDFFKNNFKNNIVSVEDYAFSNIRGFSNSLSNLFLKTYKFWFLFIPISIMFKLISIFKGDGLVIVFKK